MAKPFMSEQDAKDAYLKCVEAFEGMVSRTLSIYSYATCRHVLSA